MSVPADVPLISADLFCTLPRLSGGTVPWSVVRSPSRSAKYLFAFAAVLSLIIPFFPRKPHPEWYVSYSPVQQSISFADPRHGFAVGYYGGFFGTTNGGEQWYQQFVTPNSLYGVTMFDSTNAWAVGDAGTVLKTTSGTVTSVTTDRSAAPLTTFSLSQNYPNPFNPGTTFSFTLSNPGPATLKVYNIVGQEVAALLSGVFEAGVPYQVQFNAYGLTSGVYFARLVSGDRMQMRKILLMK